MSRRDRFVTAAIAATLAIVVAYSLLRVVDVLVFPARDPTAVALHIAMFWRLAIATLVALFASLGAFAIAPSLAKVRVHLVVAALVVLVAQTVVAP